VWAYIDCATGSLIAARRLEAGPASRAKADAGWAFHQVHLPVRVANPRHSQWVSHESSVLV